jgi:hypothetical protein
MSTPPKNREEAKNKAIKEAEIEGARIYNEGFTNITSSMNKQFTKGLEYDGDVSEALDTGYNRAKAKDKVKKASGGAVKGYKDGGKVKKMKKCRMDGIALRGKTRAKQRSK